MSDHCDACNDTGLKCIPSYSQESSGFSFSPCPVCFGAAEYIPRTELGRKFMELRKQFLAEGGKPMTAQEINAELDGTTEHLRVIRELVEYITTRNCMCVQLGKVDCTCGLHDAVKKAKELLNP